MESLLMTIRWVARTTDALGRASLEGGAVILAVWALCRLFPRLPAALRTTLWWLACLRLLVGLAGFGGIAPIRLPLLPAPAAAPVARAIEAPPFVRVAEGGGEGAVPRPAPAAAAPSVPAGSLALGALGGLWLLAVLLQGAATLREAARWRGIVARSAPLPACGGGTGAGLSGLWEELRREAGVSRARLLVSAEVATPQAVGLLRPRVLLPAVGLERLSPPELSMILCHELAHLRRGDLWLGWVPALAQRLFFFHPLAAHAVREYGLAREAACDAQVLARLDLAPQAYGRLLLTLGIAPSLPGALRVATAAPSRRHLKRRLEMLDHASRHRRTPVGWWCLLALFAVLSLVPFRFVAAQEAPRALRSLRVLRAIPALAALPAKAPASPSTPPVPPTPPTPPKPPKPPHPPRHHAATHGDEYILLGPQGSTVMNGSSADIARARKLLGPGETQLLWFRQGAKEYVVRDPGTLKTAHDLFAPQEELGAKQAELGGKQAELGSRQAALGAEQAKLGGKQAALGARQAALAGEMARRSVDGKSTADLEAEEDALGKQQDELGKQQDALGKQQDELGKQQDPLGEQQDALGRQQDKLGQEADAKLEALMREAVAKGLAVPVR